MNESPTPDDYSSTPNEASRGDRGIRQQAVSSGVALSVREVVGMLASIVFTVYALRKLGPENYGLVGLGIGISTAATGVGTLGMNVLLVQKKTLDHEEARQAMTVMVVTAMAVAAVLITSVPLIEGWLHRPGLGPLVSIVAAAVAFKLTSVVPSALLERDMRFRDLARIDLVALGVYYLVAGFLIALHGTYLAIWIGNLAQGVVALGCLLVARPVIPTLRVDRYWLLRSLRFGISFQASSWVYSLRDSVASFVLPRFAGMGALGIVTAAAQVVSRLAFLRMVVWRVAVSGMSRAQERVSALRAAVEKGAMVQALLLGGALSLVSVSSRWLFPALFGEPWKQTAVVFPFVAVAMLINGVFIPHLAVLTARARMRRLLVFNTVYVSSLWLLALVSVAMFGIWGYCAAEIVALASYWVLGGYVRREIGGIASWPVVVVAGSMVLVTLIGPFLPPFAGLVLWAIVGCAVMFGFEPSRRLVAEIRATVGLPHAQ